MESSITKIFILGAGGTGRDIVDMVHDINKLSDIQIEIVGFLDDNPELVGNAIMGYPILGELAMANTNDNHMVVNALGSPNSFRKRQELIKRLELPSNRFLSIIHPSVQIAKSAFLGAGQVIYPNVVIMSNAMIGNHVTVLSNSTINHDVHIGDYSIIASGVQISGQVTICDSCYIGTGSSIIQNVKIGSKTIIGMGSVVIKDVEGNSKIFGNPANQK